MPHFSNYFNQKSLEIKHLYKSQDFCFRTHKKSTSGGQIYVWPGFLDLCMNEGSKKIMKTFGLTSCSHEFKYKNYTRYHGDMPPPDLLFDKLCYLDVGLHKYSATAESKDILGNKVYGDDILGSDEDKVEEIIKSVNLFIRDIPEIILSDLFCS
jgi:hypothetical protein